NSSHSLVEAQCSRLPPSRQAPSSDNQTVGDAGGMGRDRSGQPDASWRSVCTKQMAVKQKWLEFGHRSRERRSSCCVLCAMEAPTLHSANLTGSPGHISRCAASWRQLISPKFHSLKESSKADC